MKTKKILAFLLVFALACAFLSACSEKPEETVSEDPLVGEWASKDFDGTFVYTFNEDGTGSYDAMGTLMPFTYTAKDGRLSILYDGDDYAFETQFTVSEDTLTVKDSLDEDVVYKRK